jgi:hypothetical protein
MGGAQVGPARSRGARSVGPGKARPTHDLSTGYGGRAKALPPGTRGKPVFPASRVVEKTPAHRNGPPLARRAGKARVRQSCIEG